MDVGRSSSAAGAAISHHGLFSHLPLHSQQQIRTPFPMIPIGGIQIVHSVRAPIPGLSHPAHLALQKSPSEQPSAGEGALQVEDGVMPSAGWDSSQAQENILCSPMGNQSLPSAREHFGKSEREGDEISDKDIKQEESIQTCTKAIASLRIASEEHREKSLSTDSLPNQQPSTSTHSPSKPAEMAALRSLPSSEFNPTQALHSSMESTFTYLPLSSTSGEEDATHLHSQGGRLLDTNRVNNCAENG